MWCQRRIRTRRARGGTAEVGVMNQRAFQFVIALACVLILAATADAQQLAKRGTYTSTFAWNSVTKVYEGDKDHIVVAGEYTGVNLTDGGQSFLHQAAVVCPAVAVVDKGVGSNQGHCIATDRDGDKAFIVWQCRAPQPGARCEGDFQWTGGTDAPACAVRTRSTPVRSRRRPPGIPSGRASGSSLTR